MFDKHLSRIALFGAFAGVLHTAFDDDQMVKQIEATGIISKQVSINPASIASGAEGTATVNVTGLTPAHRCFVTPAVDVTVGLYVRGARCAAAGVLTIDLANTSGGAIDEAAFAMNLLAIPGDLN